MLSIYSSKVSQSPLLSEKFRRQVCLYGGAVFALVLALNVVAGLFSLWWSGETLNGLSLIPLLTGILIYRRREALRGLTRNVFLPVYMASLCVGGLAWWVLGSGAIRIGGLLFVATLGLLFVSCFGKASLAIILGPLLFLCMMIPAAQSFFDTVTLGLQHLFSLTIGLLGPIINDSYVGRDGFTLWFMDGQKPIVIASECSGLRSMMGMVIMAGYFSVADRLSLGKTVAVIYTGVALALVLNLVRILITIELHLHNLKNYAEGRLHGLLGISVCLIGFVVLSKLSEKLQD